MFKIVILDGKTVFSDENIEKLKSSGEVVLYETTPPELIAERLRDADIAITNKCAIDKKIIDLCPNLKFISVLATGYNIIDISYAEKRGIRVSNVPAYSTESVVQHTFALIFELLNHTSEYNNTVHDLTWCKQNFFTYEISPITELNNTVIGIVGYGNIGKRVKEVATAFGMKTLYTRKTEDKNAVSFDELFRGSDIVTLHCPLNDDTYRIINETNLNKMKSGALLVNTSRGGLIDEWALRRALDSGKIAGAAVDVLSTEPPAYDNPLIGCDKCIITPHVAWATKEAKERLVSITESNVRGFVNGRHINPVNFI